MFLSETLVRLEGAPEIVLEKLTRLGLFKTKTEAIRAAIMDLGKDYKVFNSMRDLEDELVVRKVARIHKEIKSGKCKVFTEEEVKKKYGFK